MTKPRRPRKRPLKPTECGHGDSRNYCSVATPPFVACQACARSVITGGGGLIMAYVPANMIPPPGGSLTLHRTDSGAFVAWEIPT